MNAMPCETVRLVGGTIGKDSKCHIVSLYEFVTGVTILIVLFSIHFLLIEIDGVTFGELSLHL